jgi:hypothetical protein
MSRLFSCTILSLWEAKVISQKLVLFHFSEMSTLIARMYKVRPAQGNGGVGSYESVDSEHTGIPELTVSTVDLPNGIRRENHPEYESGA